MSRLERTLPVAGWGWIVALACGLGMASAAGVVTHGDPSDSTAADALPAALFGAGIALAAGIVAVRLARDRPVLQALGTPATLVILVAFGALMGTTVVTVDVSTGSATEFEVIEQGTATIESGDTSSLGPSVAAPRGRYRTDISDLQGTVILLGGLVLVGAAIVFLMRRSELRAVERDAVYLRSDLTLENDEPEPGPDDAALAEAFGRSLAELLAESDPRLAIRAAYGSLLNELAAIGVARHRYEGPAEHIRRCLSVHPLPAASINELLHLFELARFSRLPVTDADAERARSVLTSAIDVLNGTSV